LPSDASTGLTFTGDFTSGNVTVLNVSSLTGLYVGQALSTVGAHVAAGARIATITAPSTITMTIAAGATANTITTTREDIAKIIDAEFPANIAGQTIVGAFVEMNGYVGIMTTSGRFYNSDINAPAAWTSGNYLTCDKYAGTGISAARYGTRIACFLSGHIEFLYNAGNPSGSPFSSDSSAVQCDGASLLFSTTLTSLDSNIYWLAKDLNFYTLAGFTPKALTINGVTSAWTFNAASFSLSGFFYNRKKYLNLRNTTTNLWYCIDDGTITDPNFSAGAFIVLAHNFLTLTQRPNCAVLLNNTVGRYYVMLSESTTSFQDNGSAFTMSIQIATDMGTQKRKIYQILRLLADVQASGTLDVSWSDDDGATFSTARSIPLTDIKQMFLTRLGSGSGSRIWKYEHSANTAFRCKMIELEAEECSA
jgi:hypothetical protein